MGSRLREEGEKLALVMYMSKIFLGGERECLSFVETVRLMLYVAALKKTWEDNVACILLVTFKGHRFYKSAF